MKRIQIGLLVTVIAVAMTSIYALVGEFSGDELVYGVAGVVVGALVKLFVDTDGDGIPPLLDEDQR